MAKSKNCIWCGGKGTSDGCSHCGRTLEKPLFDNLSEQQISATISYLEDKILIPESYIGQCWNQEILINDHLDLVEDPNFVQYVASLNAIDNIFTNGLLPKRSMLIMSPTGFSKKTLIYSCMQRANSHRFSISPLLSTLDIAYLVRYSTEVNPKFKLSGVSYPDLYELDFISLYVSHTDYKYESYKIVQEVLNMRNRTNRATIIISDFSMQTLASWDENQNFVQLFKTSGYHDNKRMYPTLISYRR